LETERKKVYNFGNLTDPGQVDDGKWKGVLKDMVFRLATAEIGAGKIDPQDPPAIYELDATQKKVQDILTAENSIYSLRQGKYVISPRKALIRTEGKKEMPADQDAEKSITEITVPFTDEDGYRLVGGFPYGRDLNPICIDDSTAVSPSIDRKTYLATIMNKPAYTSEADAMDGLFFFGDTNNGKPVQKEGSVPAYARFDSQLTPPGTMPSILGAIGPEIMTEQTTADGQGTNKAAAHKLKVTSTGDKADKSAKMKSKIREEPLSGKTLSDVYASMNTTQQSYTMDP
jgi:hypothetical protein